MIIEYDNFPIAQQFTCAIAYGDYTGLSDDDADALDA